MVKKLGTQVQSISRGGTHHSLALKGLANGFVPADQEHIKKEREKARQLKKTRWWQNKIHKGKCHYCKQVFKPQALSMDHLVPLVRGGMSIKNNIVPSCKKCNFEKKHQTLSEWKQSRQPFA